jgi:hypothetical protein
MPNSVLYACAALSGSMCIACLAWMALARQLNAQAKLKKQRAVDRARMLKGIDYAEPPAAPKRKIRFGRR